MSVGIINKVRRLVQCLRGRKVSRVGGQVQGKNGQLQPPCPPKQYSMMFSAEVFTNLEATFGGALKAIAHRFVVCM